MLICRIFKHEISFSKYNYNVHDFKIQQTLYYSYKVTVHLPLAIVKPYYTLFILPIGGNCEAHINVTWSRGCRSIVFEILAKNRSNSFVYIVFSTDKLLIMWCDQAKWVWTRIKWKSCFQSHFMPHIRAIFWWKCKRNLVLLFAVS